MSGCKLSSGVNWRVATGVTAKTHKTGGHRIRAKYNNTAKIKWCKLASGSGCYSKNTQNRWA